MSIIGRVVFDTSTLVGVALKVGSVPHRAFGLALRHGEICTSLATLCELDEVLQRDKFDRYMPRSTRLELAALLRQNAQFFEVTADDEAAVRPQCRDPKDNKFLALAFVCDASVIVSSDDDLLTLSPWNGIQITTPAGFLTVEDR